MTSERWYQIEALFDAVLDLDVTERTAYLDAACADDPALRGDVEALLAAEASAPAFLEEDAAAFAAPVLQDIGLAADGPAAP